MTGDISSPATIIAGYQLLGTEPRSLARVISVLNFRANSSAPPALYPVKQNSSDHCLNNCITTSTSFHSPIFWCKLMPPDCLWVANISPASFPLMERGKLVNMRKWWRNSKTEDGIPNSRVTVCGYWLLLGFLSNMALLAYLLVSIAIHKGILITGIHPCFTKVMDGR